MNVRLLIVFIVLSAFIITCTDSKSRKRRYAPSPTISRRKRSASEEQCFSEKCLGKRSRRSTSRSPSKAAKRLKRQVYDYYVDMPKFTAKMKPKTTAKPPVLKKPVQKPKLAPKPPQLKQKIVPKTTERRVSAKPANTKSANVKPVTQTVVPKANARKIVELTKPMLGATVMKSDVKKPKINLGEMKMLEVNKSENKVPGMNKSEIKIPGTNKLEVKTPEKPEVHMPDIPQVKNNEARRPELDISRLYIPEVMMPDFQNRGAKKQKHEPRGELYISKLFIQEDLEPRDMSYKRPLRDSDRDLDELPPGERELTIKDLEDKVVATDFARKKHFIQLDQTMGLRRAVMSLLFVVIAMPALLFLLIHCCSRNPPKQKTEEEKFMESLLSKPLLSPVSFDLPSKPLLLLID